MTHTIYRICHCELSGELHVIDDEKGGCELCNTKEHRELTPETVAEAFKWYQDRLAETMKAHGEALTKELQK